MNVIRHAAKARAARRGARQRPLTNQSQFVKTISSLQQTTDVTSLSGKLDPFLDTFSMGCQVL